MTRHPTDSEYRKLNEVADDRRLELLRHAEVCAECRQVLTRCDPTAIFSLLALEPIPEFSLASLSREVEAAVREIDPVEDSGRSSRVGWRGVAAVAASVMLAIVFGFQGTRDDPVQIAQTTPAPEMTVQPVEGDSFDVAPERGLELLSSPGEAEVVSFALGETQVVMIFDKALDI